VIRVLLVDDSAALRKLMIRELQGLQREFDFAEAPNGLEALKLASQTAFDLILCDINMPKLDGVGLVRAIREGTTPPDLAGVLGPERATADDVPIVMITSDAQQELRVEEALLYGASGALAKPFTSDQLCERLAMFI
jgi:two-component system chemotaxis response regulator CheY